MTVDEILNAILFLLLGLQTLAIPWQGKAFVAGLLLVPIVLIARLVSVSIPIAVLPQINSRRGLAAILTWGGLRGGISVALLLSLSAFSGKPLLQAITYIVVVFSILVQGTTMPRLLARFKLTASENTPLPEPN